jgi:sugar (glycoside-pentoside-hexuronide) transporter
MIKNNPHAPLTRGEGFAFASGDMFGGGAQTMIAFFYLRFLTDFVGISPALAGSIIAVARIWDAVSDPLMGVITDNTRSRFGRRKPYFLVGFFGILAAVFLLWYPVQFSNPGARAAFVLVTYLFYSTIQTIVMVPYSAMSAEISTDYKERNFVNGTRLVFSQVATLLAAVLPLTIVDAFADPRTGYQVMALVFGLLFALPFLLVFLFANERVPEPEEKAKFDIKLFFKPLKLRSFRLLIGIYLSAFLINDIISAVFTYFMDYYLNRPGDLEIVLGVLLIVSTVFVPVVIYFANRYGKGRTLAVFLLVWLAGIFGLSRITPELPHWVIYIVAGVIGIGTSGGIVSPWIMYPDVTDVGELAFGKRVSGSFSGLMTFFRKAAGALALFLVGQILQIADYREPTQEIVDGVLSTTKYAQPASVITALQVLVIVIPVVLLGLLYFFVRRYPLSKEMHDRLKALLEFKRGEQGAAAVTEEDEAEIRSELI